jgi:hypothetical protein
MVRQISDDLNLRINLKHLYYGSEEAGELVRDTGLTLGAPKDVAKKAGIFMDWQAIFAIVENPSATTDLPVYASGTAAKWSPELDRSLVSCEEGAKSVGILMTPVLVVNGEVKHTGNVPTTYQIRNWLIEITS